MVTLFRITGIPVAWIFTFLEKPRWVGIAAFLLFSSDALDGYLARRLNMKSELGSKLDSCADNFLIFSSIGWLWILRPEIFHGIYLIFFIAGIITTLVSILIMYIKFKRFPPNLHLYSAKLSGILGAIFITYTLVFHFEPFLFYPIAIVFISANCEEMLIGLTRSQVNENLGSVFKKN